MENVIQALVIFSSHAITALFTDNSMCIPHVNIYKPSVQEVLRKTRGFGHIAY